jgi:hypothetical protein
MNSLPTNDYTYQVENNNKKMEALFNQMFPGVTVPYEFVFQMLQFLNETQVNAHILPRVIRGVNNILIGTGKGQVIVHVLKETMNVSVRENDEDMKSRE